MLISLGLSHETFSSLALMLTAMRFSGAAVGTGKKVARHYNYDTPTNNRLSLSGMEVLVF